MKGKAAGGLVAARHDHQNVAAETRELIGHEAAGALAERGQRHHRDHADHHAEQREQRCAAGAGRGH